MYSIIYICFFFFFKHNMAFEVYILLFFFFSSRRRHTRWNCDWSSDVCSSDLFRHAAVRALYIPRMFRGARTPAYLQRLKADALLEAVGGRAEFPLVAETLRECFSDAFDVPRLKRLLERIHDGELSARHVDTPLPSPFVYPLLLAWDWAYLGAGHAEERRSDAVVMRKAWPAPAGRLEPDAVAAVVAELQRTAPERRARDPNELAGLLEELGELTAAEVAARVVGEPGPMLDALRAEGRVRAVDFGNGRRALVSTIEVPMYAAIGARLTSGELETCPGQFGGSAPDPPALERILLRAVRTRGPVTAAELAGRYDVAEVAVAGALDAALARGALRQLPDGLYIHVAVLDEIQRRQAHARRVVRAVASPEGFAAFVLRRQHVHPDHRLVGPPGLLTALEPLQGEDFPVKPWEQELLPARLEGYEPAWLDQLGLSGDLVWTPFERRAGRVGVALRDNLGWLREPTAEPPLAEHQKRILRQLEVRGASFVQEIARGVALGGAASRAARWARVWAGLVTPDSFQAIRRGPEPAAARRDRRRYRPAGAPLTAGGRWSVFAAEDPVTAEQRDEAWAHLLLARYGVVARELARGDWSRLRQALLRMEYAGEALRGYFVEGLSGEQYARPDAVRELEAERRRAEPHVLLNVCDPANLWGVAFPLLRLDGTRAMAARIPQNWLVARGGRPVLLAEGHGP